MTEAINREIARQSQLLIEDNFDDPKEKDVLLVQTAMLIGALIALKEIAQNK